MRLFERSFGRRARSPRFVRFDSTGVNLAGVPQQLPGRDVLAMTDPNVKIGVNPGSGENSGAAGNFRGCGDGLASRKRAEIGIRFDSPIELAKEFAAIARVVLPGILPIEK